IADFGNGIITIYPDLDPFNDDSDKTNNLEDDWDVILEGIDFREIPEFDGLDLPPYVCNMGKSSKNKKKSCKNYKMKYDDERPSFTVNPALTREKLSREELEKDLWEIIVIFSEPRPIIETLKYRERYKRILDTVLLDKINLDGFEVYFQGGLCSDENINARDYWLSISSEENLNLSRSLASTIKSPVLRVLQKMITYGVCQRTTGALDATTLRELIDSNERLIAKDLAPGRMARRQSYQFDMYAGGFEYIVGQYNIPVHEAYAPPGYDEEQQED
nr:hypothetical protein [Tanacetum cinerariifolium]